MGKQLSVTIKDKNTSHKDLYWARAVELPSETTALFLAGLRRETSSGMNRLTRVRDSQVFPRRTGLNLEITSSRAVGLVLETTGHLVTEQP